jgi:hypothetical protein
MPHVPSTAHVALPPLALQALSHALQVSGDDRSASQPSAASPLQSAKPSSQIGVQAPASHTPLACSGWQLRPQPPQLASDSARSASQPLLASASQSSKPGAQRGAHVPSTQRVLPCSLTQTRPHSPQCSPLAPSSVSHPVSTSASQSP